MMGKPVSFIRIRSKSLLISYGLGSSSEVNIIIIHTLIKYCNAKNVESY